jgi:CRP-like cAMP-binding protein
MIGQYRPAHAGDVNQFTDAGKGALYCACPETSVAETVLRGIPFFSGLSDGELLRLDPALRRRRFRRSEVIFHREDPGNALYVIAAGTVKIALRSDDGREVILTLLGPGDYFGELAIIDGEPRSADAIATEDCETMVLPREAFLEFLAQTPDASLRLLQAMSRQYVRRLTDTVYDAAFLDVPARLARTLVHLVEMRRDGQDGSIEISVTQTDLAAMIGATRESINKWLGYYERQGWLKRERGSVIVLEPEALIRRFT